MRIIRVKLKPDVSAYLKTLCARFSFNDLSFFEDVYSLAATRGSGLPDDARLDKLTEAYAKINEMNKLLVRIILRKRRQVLKEMAANPLFQLFTRTRKAHPRVTTEALITFYFETYRRIRQSQCMTCNLLATCDFGQVYGKSVTAIQVVIDPDYEKKINPMCPEKPTLDMTAQMAAAQAAITAMAAAPSQLNTLPDPAAQALAAQLPGAMAEAEKLQQDNSQDADLDDDSMPKALDEEWEEEENSTGLVNNGAAPPGETNVYSTTFRSPTVPVDMNVINRIKLHNFLLFELSRKLSSKLTKAHKGKFKPTTTANKNQKTTQITSVSDVTKVMPREHAQDDAVFERKLLQNNLSKRQFQKPDQKRKLQYILLDTSNSMTSCVGVGQPFWAVVTRGLLAASFMISILELMESEDGIVFVRGFDGSTSPLASARTPEEYKLLKLWVSRCGFNGCSTDIEGALSRAYADIAAAKDELRDAEILLITDCGAQFPPSVAQRMRAAAGKTVLNVLDVASNSSGIELAAGQSLRQMADHYFKVDGAAATLDKMVSLVGGSKSNTPAV